MLTSWLAVARGIKHFQRRLEELHSWAQPKLPTPQNPVLNKWSSFWVAKFWGGLLDSSRQQIRPLIKLSEIKLWISFSSNKCCSFTALTSLTEWLAAKAVPGTMVFWISLPQVFVFATLQLSEGVFFSFNKNFTWNPQWTRSTFRPFWSS